MQGMTASRLPLDAKAGVFMLILCVVWSLQQPVLKLAASDIDPLLHIALRSGLAAGLVAAVMAWRKTADTAPGLWQPGLLAGGLFALEYLCVGQALRWTSSGHVVVLLYTAPVFAALGLQARIPQERLHTLQWGGVALAFAGVALSFLGGDVASTAHPQTLWGDLLALAGGVAWGATTVVIRCSRLAQASAAQTLFYQLVGACVLLLAAAGWLGHTQIHPTPLMWGSLAFQTLVVSFLSFLAWFWLLGRYVASGLGIYTFLTPLFGVALGAWLLDETVDPHFLLGSAITLSGVAVVSRYEDLQSWMRRWRTP